MQSWIMSVMKRLRKAISLPHDKGKVVVMWEDAEGEATAFVCSNFNEVRLWLDHAKTVGKLH